MKKSDEIRKAIADATDRAEALVNLAKDKDGKERELNADEQKTWSAIMAKDTGELATLEGQLQTALAHEAEVDRLRAARTTNSTPTPVYNQNGTPAGADGASLPNSVRVINPTLKAFAWAKDKDTNLRNAYDCGLWLKATIRRDQASIDALAARRGDWMATFNENNPQDGGYLVVPEFERSIITYREQVGVSRRLARVIQMGSDTYTFQKQSGGTTVYYPGEEGSITASDFDVSRVSLVAKKRAILSYISNELNADAMISIVDLLTSDMGHQFALQEDKEVILGDGTSTYGGVFGLKPAITAATAGVSQAATGNDLWSELTYADIAACMSKISDKYRNMPLAFVCSAPFKWQVFDRLALAQGGSLTINMIDGVPQAMFDGYPVIVTDRMPTTTAAATICAMFGSFENCLILGERAGIRIATSEHVGFTTDQIAVRATTRYDVKVHEQGDTSTAGALAALKTAA